MVETVIGEVVMGRVTREVFGRGQLVNAIKKKTHKNRGYGRRLLREKVYV